jgi:catechol 2,3-dioxygenase-like lactoylglutathione lyase family enzyme
VSGAHALSRIDLISADPDRLAVFYGGLGFARVEGAAIGQGERARLRLRLGDEKIDLVGPSYIGAPYPDFVPGWSTVFQHFAIVVTDMRQAYERLEALSGWSAISRDGPQKLPDSSGGVTAFKFRDPEGHPLELIAFPANANPERWRTLNGEGIFRGIDHSAISVTDTKRSADFYARLGLNRHGGSINSGPEQVRLDDITQVDVEVSALSTTKNSPPHVELLQYRGDYNRIGELPSLFDIAASRLVFSIKESEPKPDAQLPQRDPDGHVVVLEEANRYSGST